ncbi:MAG: YciI family protein [Bacteroidota bacterium]
MKEYMLLFRGGLDFATVSPEVMQQSMMKWMTWMDGLKADGTYIGGERLTQTGAVLSGPQKQLSDGPYAEGKEVVAGFIAIKANDLQQAIEIAKGCPIYEYDGSTEVQEIAKM